MLELSFDEEGSDDSWVLSTRASDEYVDQYSTKPPTEEQVGQMKEKRYSSGKHKVIRSHFKL